LHVGGEDLAAVGEIRGTVGGIVVYEDYGDVAGGLEEWEDGVVLEG